MKRQYDKAQATEHTMHGFVRAIVEIRWVGTLTQQTSIQYRPEKWYKRGPHISWQHGRVCLHQRKRCPQAFNNRSKTPRTAWKQTTRRSCKVQLCNKKIVIASGTSVKLIEATSQPIRIYSELRLPKKRGSANNMNIPQAVSTLCYLAGQCSH